MKIDETHKHIKYCLTAMKLMRTHPEIPRNFKWALGFILAYGALMSTLPFIIHNTYVTILNKEFSEACQTGIFCIACFGATLNNFIMLYHRDKITHLLNMMKYDYIQMKNLSVGDQMIYQKYMKKEHFLCKQWLLMTIVSVGLFNAKAILTMTYYYIIGEMRLVNMHEIIYPDFIEKRKEEILVYLCIYCIILYCGCYSCVNNLSITPLGPVLMLHACGQLEVIKGKIDGLFDGDTRDVHNKLKEIVKKLQYTYNFVEQINIPFRFFYDATLSLSSVVLPFTFYALLQSIARGQSSLEFSSFIVTGVLMSSTPCYYSDLLLEKGEEVSLALYSCGWERQYDQSVRSTILILLIRSTRPIVLRTVFKTLCLKALTNMFSQAYTIFSLLNAVML